jgi:hypothetical protein
VTLPAATPVTTPLLLTKAIFVLLLDHVPPGVVLISVIVLPMHTLVGPEIGLMVGKEFTVTEEVVLLHPVFASVNVNVTVPADTPVITPEFVTVALAVLLLIQVPPVVGDNVAVLPTQTDAGAVTVGKE